MTSRFLGNTTRRAMGSFIRIRELKVKFFQGESEVSSRYPNESESESHSVLSYSLRPGQSTGVGSLCLLQGIFPTQGSNPGLPHCRQSLYQLSHKGSPRILEWAAYPFSSRSSRPRNQTRVSRVAGRFFTS